MAKFKEIWKEIKGFDQYLVSNTGYVKSLGNEHSRRDKILLQSTNNIVVLIKDGQQYRHKVAHLVAAAFLEWNGEGWIAHADKNKHNCAVSNLRVVI